jgi:hypothetical protein
MNTLFDEPITLQSLLSRIEALEAKLMDKPVANRTECPPEIRHAWGLWSLHRAGKGWTAQARKLCLAKLVELSGLNGELAERIVNQSIERGWTGLFAVKDTPKLVSVKSVAQAMKPSETPLERDIARARHDCHIGMIDTAERDRRIAEATNRHRGL